MILHSKGGGAGERGYGREAGVLLLFAGLNEVAE